MKFTHISDLPAFLRRIDACGGPVSYLDSEGKERDLKELSTRLAGLDGRFLGAQLDEIEVRASRLSDRQSLMQYMVEMCCPVH